MPQLDVTTYASQLVWLAITFIALYFLMARIALPRVGEILEEREERIADDIDEAERLRREGAELQGKFDNSLAEARAEAMKIVQAARAKAQAEISAQMKALDAKLSAEEDKVAARIDAERTKALAELEVVAAEACTQIVAKVTGTDSAVPTEGVVAAAVRQHMPDAGRA